MNVIFLICTAVVFLAAVFQGIVALIELNRHSVRSGRKKKWFAILLVVCVALSIVFGYASLPKTSSKAPLNIAHASTATPTTAPTPTATLTTAPTPTATLTTAPTPTATLTTALLPTVTPTPPKIGTILYQADWSNSLDGWGGGTEWKVNQGMLLSDGTNCCGGSASTIEAPYQFGNIGNYEVQAQIQFIGTDNICSGYSFGIMVRMNSNEMGYEGGANLANGACYLNDSYATLNIGGAKIRFVPDTNWHTYTVKAQGDQITLLIDGTQMLTAMNNTYLDGGQVGIEDFNVQMNIKDFNVIAL